MAFLAELKASGDVKKLRSVPQDERNDRSGPNTDLGGKDVLDDEADRWKYFFDSGAEAWFKELKAYTFRSTFVELRREEAAVIVEHWERRDRAVSAGEDAATVDELFF